MASYKVIQDIEAEDKLLGPLTLRQFIYAAVAVLCFYLTFVVVSKGAAFLSVVFLPVGAIAGFFAWPWSRDQPTEIWALAKIRFMLKPRKRIWDQSGTKELVTVTAPKRIETVYTNGLSQDEVENRLRALADMIDSRGWATKNVNINLYSGQEQAMTATSDRLVGVSTLPAVVEENIDIRADDDIMEDTNPVARQFDSMIAASTKAHRDEILAHLREPEQPQTPAPAAQQGQPANNYWFLNQPAAATQVPQDAVTFNTQVISPVAPVQASNNPSQATQLPPAANDVVVTPEQEQALIEQLHEQEIKESSVNPFGHYHTIQPLSAQAQAQQDLANQQMQAGYPVTPTTAVAQPYPQQPAQGQSYATQPMPQTGPQMSAQMSPLPAPGQPIQYAQNPMTQSVPQQVTQASDPAILQLASNDDLDVATIAREANKRKELQDEVVISLH